MKFLNGLRIYSSLLWWAAKEDCRERLVRALGGTLALAVALSSGCAAYHAAERAHADSRWPACQKVCRDKTADSQLRIGDSYQCRMDIKDDGRAVCTIDLERDAQLYSWANGR